MEEKNKLSRRGFLRLSGMATAAVAAASMYGCSPAKEGVALGGLGGLNVNFTKKTDVAIIGTGFSGLWAARELLNAGITPILIEKNPSYGGDSLLACGNIRVRGTVVQKAFGIQDLTPEEAWEADKEKYADSKVPELQRLIYIYSPEVIRVFTEEFGIEWIDMNTPRWTKHFHVHKDGLHNVDKLVKPLYEYVKNKGAEFLFETRAISLITNNDNEVVGVRVKDEVSGEYVDIEAKKTIIAAGGWAANQEMISKFSSPYVKVASHVVNSMGEGILMGVAAGGALTENMGKGLGLGPDFVTMTTVGLYDSIINVSPTGERIGDEYNYSGSTVATINNKWFYFWTIYDEKIRNGVMKGTYDEKEEIGGVLKADSIEELAEITLLPLDNLRATIEKFNSDAENGGVDTQFNKPIGIDPIHPPFYAVKSFPVRYAALGGLQINDKCEVVDKNFNPIKNLYAVGQSQGEITLNIYGVSSTGMHAGKMIVEELKGK